MSKYSVGVLSGFEIDSYVKTVYKGDSPFQAIKVWAKETRKNPTMVAIYASRKADADAFYADCANNINSIKEICGEGFPYKWDYIEKSLLRNATQNDFHEIQIWDDEYAEDQLDPFSLG